MVLGHGLLTPPEWVRPDAPERFAAAVARRAAEPGSDRVHHWRTFERLGAELPRTCLLTTAASGRRLDVAALVRSLDHMVAAHVLAFELLKDHRPSATVSLSLAATGVYELDRLPLDILVARTNGVARDGMGPWIAARRAEHHRRTPAPLGPLGRMVRALAAANVAGERALPRAVAAAWASPHERLLDDVEEAPRASTSGRATGPSWRRTRPGR